MRWSARVKKHAKRMYNETENTARTAVISVMVGTINATPVDTGRARGNWMLGEAITDTPAQGVVPAANAIAEVSKYKTGGMAYFYNNLPYVWKLEYEGYSQKQAPQGMLRLNVQRISTIIKSK